ncbi:unnamed protein product, partial [Nesidiocoris tenuis]
RGLGCQSVPRISGWVRRIVTSSRGHFRNRAGAHAKQSAVAAAYLDVEVGIPEQLSAGYPRLEHEPSPCYPSRPVIRTRPRNQKLPMEWEEEMTVLLGEQELQNSLKTPPDICHL